MENKNELKALTERIVKQLGDFYNGENWVSENLENKIFSLLPSVAFTKVNGHSHSIAELVCDIISWRNFVIQKLTGNDAYDIEDNSLIDWAAPSDWYVVRKEFDASHHNLLKSIAEFDIDKWHTKVPGRNYSFLYLINGIVEHDYYHYGQISSVLAAIKKMQ